MDARNQGPPTKPDTAAAAAAPGASARAAAAAVAAVWLAACAPAERAGSEPDVALLALSAEPVLRIGLLEGDERYTFDDVTGVLRRADGGILVSDGGSTEITLYDADGAFVRRWGRRGEGPGELRALSRIYPHGWDSVLAFDPRSDRVSVFGIDGGFGRQMDPAALSGDPVFRLDVWLYGRFWVDGALGPDERARVRSVLDRLPSPPREAPGFRLVRVSSDGRLWIREPGLAADGTRGWTILDSGGVLAAFVRVPARFDPLHIGVDEVLGRWLGESDVAFVHAYRIEDTGATGQVPSWLAAQATSRSGAAEAAVAPGDQALEALVREAIRSMARAQEIHYSRAMTYTAIADSLDWERPEGIVADFVRADRRGWAAAFTHPAVDRVCGLGYGTAVPAGWLPGAVLCGPVAGAASAEPAGMGASSANRTPSQR